MVSAKLGSDYKKPDATTVFSKSNWKQFIYPLSVRDLLFVGKKTGDELERLGVKTIGQLAKYDEHILVRHFGKAGNMLYRYANGLDSEPVKSIYEKEKVKSVGNGMTFRQDLVGEEDVRSGIYALSDSVAARLRRKYEMHDSANIDKKSAIQEYKPSEKTRKAYICFKRYTQCGDGACKKILEFKIADTNDVCNGNKPCRRE